MELIIHGRVVLTHSFNRRTIHYRRAVPWSYIGLAEYPLAVRASGYSASVQYSPVVGTFGEDMPVLLCALIYRSVREKLISCVNVCLGV